MTKLDKLLKSIKVIFFDFDGVFTDNFVYVNQEGIESVRCLRSDGIGISRLKNIGIKMYIISTEENKVVRTRSNKLNLPCIQNVSNKAEVIKEICSELDVSLSEVAFLGNDINDIPALKIVGVPLGVADSFDEIDKYILKRLSKKGGNGVVRELCDLVYNLNLI